MSKSLRIVALSAAALLILAGMATAQAAPVLAFQTLETGATVTAGEKAAVALDASGAYASSKQSVKLTVTGEGGDPHDNLQCAIFRTNDGKPLDVSAYKYFFFWIKDTQGANTHMVTVIDSKGGEWNGWVDVKSAQDNWVKITMPVKTAKGVDLTAVQEIRIGEWNAGVYYLDDLYFGNKLADKLP